MRKITLHSMISLDGVMQAPGNPEEDPSNGFLYGGWTAPFSDKIYHREVMKELQEPSDYLLGRKTWEIWADYWPYHDSFWPNITKGTKFLLSKSLKSSDPRVVAWKNSQVIHSVEDIRELKNSKGQNLQVWGSSELAKLLFQYDLIDELRLKIHPLILGKGKNLFSPDLIPASFRLIGTVISSTGVIIANYQREGEIKTGTQQATDKI